MSTNDVVDVLVKSHEGRWHAQPVSLTMRHFPKNAKESFAQHLPFDACAQVQLFGKSAWVHTALTSTDKPLSARDWRDLGAVLWEEYGVETVVCDRDGEVVSMRTPKRPLKEHEIYEWLRRFPELNMANFNCPDVDDLNNWGIEGVQRFLKEKEQSQE